jgi:hypothetical protein
VCALLLAITYHISGPHAILLYQALHDVAAKAFRRELRAADVTVEFVSRDGTISSKTISHEGARSFRKVAALAATLGVEPSDGFLATHVSGECVRVHDEQSLGLVLDGLINVERQESAQPRLRLTATPKTALKERLLLPEIVRNDLPDPDILGPKQDLALVPRVLHPPQFPH